MFRGEVKPGRASLIHAEQDCSNRLVKSGLIAELNSGDLDYFTRCSLRVSSRNDLPLNHVWRDNS
jgi:hypothetical protein